MQHTDSPTAVLNGTDQSHPHATPVVPVKPLHYTQLRLLAEIAVGVKDTPLDFYFRQGEALELAGAAAAGPEDVVVTARDRVKYPANHLALDLTPADQPRHDAQVPAGMADALFWSDAAVEKFLFPYVASCGGDEGASALASLQAAWNHYPRSKVQVYALLHVNRIESGTPLALANTLWVVYVPTGGTSLQMLPVNEFLTTFRHDRGPDPEPYSTPPIDPVPYSRGADPSLAQYPAYPALRALAEWACSVRGAPQYFVFREGQEGFGPPSSTLPTDLRPGDLVVPVLTPAVPADRPPLGSVWFYPKGQQTPVDLAKNCDAVFWSTGAIEQFLFPYYASKIGFAGLEDLTRMRDVWQGKKASAAKGGEPEVRVLVAGAGGGTDDDSGDDEVAALVHLHTSEWTEVENNGEIEPVPTDETFRRVELTRGLGVLHTAAGTPAVERMDAFIRARRRG